MAAGHPGGRFALDARPNRAHLSMGMEMGRGQMRCFIGTGFLAATIAFAGTSTADAQATADEARDIAAVINRYIDDRILEPNPELYLDLNGPIEVRAVGDRYQGMIPAGRLLVDIDQGHTVNFEFSEPLTFETRVTDRGWYDIAFTVPSSFRTTVGNATEMAATFQIGNQSGAVVVAPEYDAPVDIDVRWSNMSLVFAHLPDAIVSVAEFAILQQSEARTERIFDSEFSLDVAGVEILMPDENILIELDAAGLFGSVAGLDYPALSRFIVALDDLIQRLDENPENLALYEELRVLIAETPTFLADFQIAEFIEGLRMEGPYSAFSMVEATSGSTVSGLDTNRATIAHTFNTTGFEIPKPWSFERMLAADMGYEVRLVDLPTDMLLEWIDSVLIEVQEVGPNDSLEEALFALYEQVAERGAFLEIADIHYTNETGGLEVSAEVRPDTSAVFGVTSSGEMAVTNMAQLIQFLQEPLNLRDDDVAFLTAIQALGAMETNERDEPVHVYQIELARDGVTMLNGNDLGPIMEQMQ